MGSSEGSSLVTVKIAVCDDEFLVCNQIRPLFLILLMSAGALSIYRSFTLALRCWLVYLRTLKSCSWTFPWRG